MATIEEILTWAADGGEIPTEAALHKELTDLTTGEMNEKILSQLQFEYDGAPHLWLPIRLGSRVYDESAPNEVHDLQPSIELYRCLKDGESEPEQDRPLHEWPFPIVMGMWVQTGSPDDQRRILPIAPVGPIEKVHEHWMARSEPRPGHPLIPLVEAWQKRLRQVTSGMVTTANRAYVRRPVTLSYVARTGWQDDGEIPVVLVDGEAMATRVPDLYAKLIGTPRQKLRRKYKPNEQIPLKLPGVPTIPNDLRLARLAWLPPVLASDVLTLLQIAYAIDWPGIILSDTEGAALLARTRDGGYRRPQAVDVERFREAFFECPGPVWYQDRYGLRDARELASIGTQPDGRRRLGPPEWMRGGPSEKWTLSAAGAFVARARNMLDADGSPAGRIVTGIEYRLAARWDGRPGVAPDLRPEHKGGPGPVVFLPWHEVLNLGGIFWDRSDPKADKAALNQYKRALDRMETSGYRLLSLNTTAKAGDAIELTGIQTGGGKGRQAGLWVRASSRFVEAAKLAHLRDGRGFEGVHLVDWLGLKSAWNRPCSKRK